MDTLTFIVLFTFIESDSLGWATVADFFGQGVPPLDSCSSRSNTSTERSENSHDGVYYR